MATRARSFTETVQDNTLARASNFRDNLRRGGLEYLSGGPGNTQFIPATENIYFNNHNTSFSGTDVLAVVVYNQYMLILGNLETISYSIFREKMPVRTLGYKYPKDYTRGGRTIAGSMVFCTFDEHPLYNLFQFFEHKPTHTDRYSSPIADEIPPFDLMLVFQNEYGAESVIRLYAVEMVQEGGVFSINDIYSENTMQFIARDMDPMISGTNKNSWKRLLYQKQLDGKLIDQHFASLLKYGERLHKQLADIDAQIRNIQDQYGIWKGSISREWRGTSFSATRRGEKEAAKKKVESLERQKIPINQEIIRLNDHINNYERIKTSWDMNSGLSGVDVNTNPNSKVPYNSIIRTDYNNKPGPISARDQ